MAEILDNNTLYCNSLTEYSRFVTREVMVGDMGIGAENPIRIQSMTTTDTMDTIATVEQSVRMIDAGCEIVRITAPSINEAKNLQFIKDELKKRGYKTPLCADIHFTPNAAEAAARIVEKVRVNPGNYADKKKFETLEYSDASYESELQRIRERFIPLVKICKEYGTAMRIGTNHGSLSDRIMSRYGDSAIGMVESALEFARICQNEGYYNIVFSMKSSNPQVMVHAYRLLVMKMKEEEMNYPLHLGVTEAGEGEDGRIKSAVGIGTLLEDGLGDTIRVSLTEEPELEIPVAKTLAARYTNRKALQKPITEIDSLNAFSPVVYERRFTHSVGNIGGNHVPVVIADLSTEKQISRDTLKSLGYSYSEKLDKWNIADQACDYIFLGKNKIDFEIPGTLGILDDLVKNKTVLVFETDNEHGMAEQRRMFLELLQRGILLPVIVKREYNGVSDQDLQLAASTDFGGLLIDGFGDGIWIKATNDLKLINSLAFGILQATRTRISKTEYISCPSCGRTLFDLQETTAKIRKRTDHLKGLKIGIMGCIVNGPGEMADADYGYVGSGPGKITLYKGKEVVKRNVPADKAVDELIDLIRNNGDWIEAD